MLHFFGKPAIYSKFRLFSGVFILLLLTLPLSAQFSIGLKGQINTQGAPIVANEDFFIQRLQATFNPGVTIFGTYDLRTHFSLQGEATFREYRSNYRLRNAQPTVHTSQFQYVQLALLSRWSITQKEWGFHFSFGGYLAKALRMYAGNTVNFMFHQEINFEQLSFNEYPVQRLDAGLSARLGIEKSITSRFKTTLELQYDHGLVDIMQDDTSTFYNQGFALAIGILFPLSFPK